MIVFNVDVAEDRRTYLITEEKRFIFTTAAGTER